MITKNFKLLLEDVKAPFLSLIRSRRNEKENFTQENRKEVLYLYRHMLKKIPPMHNCLLEKRCSYEVSKP